MPVGVRGVSPEGERETACGKDLFTIAFTFSDSDNHFQNCSGDYVTWKIKSMLENHNTDAVAL